MRKSVPLTASSSNKIPSAPIPRCRSQRRAIWLRSRWTSPARLSIRTKSFPAPFIFVKRSIRFHLAYSGGTANRRCQLRVWRLLIPREKTRCFGFHRGFGTDLRDSVCWRLQRIDSRSDQTNAQGGRYSVSGFAKIRLQSSAHFESGEFFILPSAALPSFWSGPTYL